MTNPIASVLTQNFDDAAMASTPKVLREYLLGTTEVAQIRDAYEGQFVSRQEVEEFVRTLVRKHLIDDAFPRAVSLAAICVALERFQDSFSKTYISELSQLRIRGFELVSRVAEISKATNESLATTQNEVGNFEFGMARAGLYLARALSVLRHDPEESSPIVPNAVENALGEHLCT